MCNMRCIMSKPGFCHQNELQNYAIIEKECNFIFHMIYYICVYALSIHGYADRNKLLYLCKITEPRKRKLKVEILYELKEF